MLAPRQTAMLDIPKVREQVPITRQRFRELGEAEPKPLIYLDHGASTHPPTPVLETYKEILERSYDGTVDCEDLERKPREHPVQLVAVTGASNVTGRRLVGGGHD